MKRGDLASFAASAAFVVLVNVGWGTGRVGWWWATLVNCSYAFAVGFILAGWRRKHKARR